MSCRPVSIAVDHSPAVLRQPAACGRDIYYANQSQIPDPNVISIGQALTIPGSGTARAATNAASATPAQAGDTPSSAPAQTGDQYKNPIGPGLTPGRVDMGVDYGGAGPVYALGNGKITSVYNPGWPGGGFIGLQLSDGSGALRLLR